MSSYCYSIIIFGFTTPKQKLLAEKIHSDTVFFFLFLSSHFNVSDTAAAAAFILFPFGPAYLERLSYQRSTNFVSKAADVSGTLLGVNSLLPSVGR